MRARSGVPLGLAAKRGHVNAMAGESWLTAALHMANPYCICKLTRVRSRSSAAGGRGGRERAGAALGRRRPGAGARRLALEHATAAASHSPQQRTADVAAVIVVHHEHRCYPSSMFLFSVLLCDGSQQSDRLLIRTRRAGQCRTRTERAAAAAGALGTALYHSPRSKCELASTKWPKSSRIAVQCAPSALNGPNHLGFAGTARCTGPRTSTMPRRSGYCWRAGLTHGCECLTTCR